MAMKVKTITEFFDIEAKKMRASGDVFECTQGRYASIAAALPGYVEELSPSSRKAVEKKAKVESR